MTDKLKVLAGEKAIEIIREKGLAQEDVKVIAGAAGGPKWLVLNHLDKYIFSSWLKDRKSPVFLIGSSIGAWRFAAASRKDPLSSINKFENAYIHQSYSARPSPEDVTRESIRIRDEYLSGEGAREILHHPFLRFNIMTVRCRGLSSSDNRLSLAAGLGMAALMNAVSRKFLRIFFERALFYNPGNPPPFLKMNQFHLQSVQLDENNLKTALLASGSIPLVMSGVKNIPSARPGTYRDGGVIDYHMDLPFLGREDGIVLYPHYMPRVIPGWLDKRMTWRKPQKSNMAGVVLVAPSDKFVKTLPHGKIPDRNDFMLFKGKDKERVSYWKKVVTQSRQLAESFHEMVESGRIRQMVKPLL